MSNVILTHQRALLFASALQDFIIPRGTYQVSRSFNASSFGGIGPKGVTHSTLIYVLQWRMLFENHFLIARLKLAGLCNKI